jgi:hypothetical protein
MRTHVCCSQLRAVVVFCSTPGLLSVSTQDSNSARSATRGRNTTACGRRTAFGVGRMRAQRGGRAASAAAPLGVSFNDFQQKAIYSISGPSAAQFRRPVGACHSRATAARSTSSPATGHAGFSAPPFLWRRIATRNAQNATIPFFCSLRTTTTPPTTVRNLNGTSRFHREGLEDQTSREKRIMKNITTFTAAFAAGAAIAAASLLTVAAPASAATQPAVQKAEIHDDQVVVAWAR